MGGGECPLPCMRTARSRSASSRARVSARPGRAAARIGSASDGLWSGEKNRNLNTWETATWKVVCLVDVPLQRFHGLAFSPDGKRLATASTFGEVLLWNLKKEK